MEITPHIGVASIKFGMTEQEITELLGDPSLRESIEFEEDDSESIEVEYEDLGMELTFSSDDDFRLGTIITTNEESTLFGLRLIGKDELFLKQDAVKDVLSDLKLEDDFDDLDAKDYYSEKYSVSIWVQDRVISSITLFPEQDDSEDGIAWPRLS